MSLNLVSEDGWKGVFTRDQAEGAIPNGAVVEKVLEDTPGGDLTPVGTRGTVLGSFDGSVARIPGPCGPVKFFYFVEWADKPRIAVGMMDFKIARVR